MSRSDSPALAQQRQLADRVERQRRRRAACEAPPSLGRSCSQLLPTLHDHRRAAAAGGGGGCAAQAWLQRQGPQARPRCYRQHEGRGGSRAVGWETGRLAGWMPNAGGGRADARVRTLAALLTAPTGGSRATFTRCCNPSLLHPSRALSFERGTLRSWVQPGAVGSSSPLTRSPDRAATRAKHPRCAARPTGPAQHERGLPALQAPMRQPL